MVHVRFFKLQWSFVAFSAYNTMCLVCHLGRQPIRLALPVAVLADLVGKVGEETFLARSNLDGIGGN